MNEVKKIKVLWFINFPLAEASSLMKKREVVFGGWIQSISSKFSKNENIDLSIAFPKYLLTDVRGLTGENIKYYVFPSVKLNTLKGKYNKDINKIIEMVNPELVHVFGTEYLHAYEVAKLCSVKKIKLLITIQGLVSKISFHYDSKLPIKIKYGFTFRELLTFNNILSQKYRMKLKGKREIEAIRFSNNITGRTTWDKACTKQIAPHANYYDCNETLRDSFYDNKWDIDNCERNSIFVSQGSYPIKGLHFLIEAFSIVVKTHNNAKLYVSGPNIVNVKGVREKFRRSSYGKYIASLIKRYNLKNKIVFLGELNEQQICDRYLKSHVFVCPSSIENSPNSLGEAMLLGVPSIASYVGGIPDMLNSDNTEGILYQYDAPYMLSYQICRVFDDDQFALKLSKNGRLRAMRTHNPVENFNRMLNIYYKILNNNENINQYSKRL